MLHVYFLFFISLYHIVSIFSLVYKKEAAKKWTKPLHFVHFFLLQAELDLNVIHDQLYALIAFHPRCVQHNIVIYRVGPVLSAKIIIIIFRPVFIRIADQLMGMFLRYVHLGADGTYTGVAYMFATSSTSMTIPIASILFLNSFLAWMAAIKTGDITPSTSHTGFPVKLGILDCRTVKHLRSHNISQSLSNQFLYALHSGTGQIIR